MKYIKTYFYFFLSLFIASCSNTSKTNTVYFQPDTLSLLRNPCMGWGLYDDANDKVQNADKYWAAQHDAAEKYASFFYVRWRWSEMEPEEGKYAWIYDDNYKKLIKGALDRGLKLCFRVYNHSQDNFSQSTPDYVRKAGAKGYFTKGLNGEKLWTPYPDDEVFLQKLEKFVQAFAREYDNPVIVDFVDAYNVGLWGECHGIALLNPGQENLEKLLDRISTIYSSNFKNVMLALPFASQVGFEAENKIAISGKGYSMRRDGLGSMWYSESQQKIARSMYGKTLLIGESCWWSSCSDSVRPFATDKVYKLNTWRDVYELTCKQALEDHFNTLDLRELPETEGWTKRAPDLVEKFISKGGYRIYPMSVSYPYSIGVGDSVCIKHRWTNIATGYIPNNVKNWRFKYKPAFALISESGNVVKCVVDVDAEPSEWLYNVEKDYSLSFSSHGIEPGNYKLCVALVNREKDNAPEIKLAIQFPEMIDGWYVVGDLSFY